MAEWCTICRRGYANLRRHQLGADHKRKAKHQRAIQWLLGAARTGTAGPNQQQGPRGAGERATGDKEKEEIEANIRVVDDVSSGGEEVAKEGEEEVVWEFTEDGLADQVEMVEDEQEEVSGGIEEEEEDNRGDDEDEEGGTAAEKANVDDQEDATLEELLAFFTGEPATPTDPVAIANTFIDSLRYDEPLATPAELACDSKKEKQRRKSKAYKASLNPKNKILYELQQLNHATDSFMEGFLTGLRGLEFGHEDVAANANILRELGKELFPPLQERSVSICGDELYYVSPLDVIVDRYRRKLDLSDEHCHYEPSDRIEHMCNCERFRHCERCCVCLASSVEWSCAPSTLMRSSTRGQGMPQWWAST